MFDLLGFILGNERDNISMEILSINPIFTLLISAGCLGLAQDPNVDKQSLSLNHMCFVHEIACGWITEIPKIAGAENPSTMKGNCVVGRE